MDNIYEFLKNLQNGRIIRKVFSIFLIMVGILICLGILAGLGFKLTMINKYNIVGETISIIASLFCLACICIIFTYNAAQVRKIKDSPYTVTMISSIALRFTGETIATFIVTAGISALLGGELSPLLGGRLFRNYNFYNFESGGSAFLLGLLALLTSLVIAFSVLVFFYFIAERLMVATDTAINIKQLVDASQQGKYTNITDNTCPNCSHPFTEGDTYCENCGYKLG